MVSVTLLICIHVILSLNLFNQKLVSGLSVVVVGLGTKRKYVDLKMVRVCDGIGWNRKQQTEILYTSNS